MMIIRIQDATSKIDTYVHFNRMIGFNSGTKEGGDQVIVSTRPSGVNYAASTLVAKLNPDRAYTISGIGGSGDSVTITVKSIDTSSTPARAMVSVQLVPNTAAPSSSPSGSPSGNPSESPSDSNAPSSKPSLEPSGSPIGVPSTSPSGAPSTFPSAGPSLSPSGAPSAAPSVSDAPTATILDCVLGEFKLELKGYCSYTALLSSFEDWFAEQGNAIADCTSSAEEQLARLLNVNANATGDLLDEVHSICSGAFKTYEKVPFKTSTGADECFVEDYYKGIGDWNEQVATLFPEYDGAGTRNKETMLLKRDAELVNDFHNEEGRHVELPNLPNFESCEMNAGTWLFSKFNYHNLPERYSLSMWLLFYSLLLLPKRPAGRQ